MINLWNETIKKLEENNKSWKDVIIIYGEDFQITKRIFKLISKKTEYIDGFGRPDIAIDLTIIGTDFVMYRKEYNGAEFWEFIPTTFSIPKEFKKITTLGGGRRNTLKELNQKKG